MTAITRWVLAHKRLVVAFWIILTLVGGAVSGPASKALKQKFSVPGKEGWQTNQQIAQALPAARAATPRRCCPVVTLPAGTTAQPAKGDLAVARAQDEPGAARRARRRLRLDRQQAFVSKDGRTAFAIAYPLPDPDQPFGDNPKAEKKLRRGAEGRRRSRARPCSCRASTRSTSRAATPTAPACSSRRCSAASARCSCSRSCSARSWRSSRS